jgi:hypothetical protein
MPIAQQLKLINQEVAVIKQEIIAQIDLSGLQDDILDAE